MPDLPTHIQLHEEEPREGFQIEPGPIDTADKVRFIEALAATGLVEIECLSRVNPVRLPGMADAYAVVRAIRKRDGVRCTSLGLSLRGYERSFSMPLGVRGSVGISASEAFAMRNNGKNTAGLLEEQHAALAFCIERGLPASTVRAAASAAFSLRGMPALAPTSAQRTWLSCAKTGASQRSSSCKRGGTLPVLRNRSLVTHCRKKS